MRRRIWGGDFDVVLRVSPINSVMPSPFAFFLRKGPIPFVIGPINGGLPWPKGFSQADRQKQQDTVAGLRNCYRFLPFARSTYQRATAIIAGSSQTYHEFSATARSLFRAREWAQPVSPCERRAHAAPDDKLELSTSVA